MALVVASDHALFDLRARRQSDPRADDRRAQLAAIPDVRALEHHAVAERGARGAAAALDVEHKTLEFACNEIKRIKTFDIVVDLPRGDGHGVAAGGGFVVPPGIDPATGTVVQASTVAVERAL